MSSSAWSDIKNNNLQKKKKENKEMMLPLMMHQDILKF